MLNPCTARNILVHDSVRLFGLPARSRFAHPAASPKGLRHGHLSCSAWGRRHDQCRDTAVVGTPTPNVLMLSSRPPPRPRHGKSPLHCLGAFVLSRAFILSQSPQLRRPSTGRGLHVVYLVGLGQEQFAGNFGGVLRCHCYLWRFFAAKPSRNGRGVPTCRPGRQKTLTSGGLRHHAFLSPLSFPSWWHRAEHAPFGA